MEVRRRRLPCGTTLLACLEWQADAKRRAVAGLAVDVDEALTLLDDSVNYRQTEARACAGSLGREERRAAIAAYWRIGPPLAAHISNDETLRGLAGTCDARLVVDNYASVRSTVLYRPSTCIRTTTLRVSRRSGAAALVTAACAPAPHDCLVSWRCMQKPALAPVSPSLAQPMAAPPPLRLLVSSAVRALGGGFQTRKILKSLILVPE